MTIDKCFECNEVSEKKNDMGEHGYITYCNDCKIGTYHKYLPVVPFNYEIMKRQAMKIEKTYNFYQGDQDD